MVFKDVRKPLHPAQYQLAIDALLSDFEACVLPGQVHDALEGL